MKPSPWHRTYDRAVFAQGALKAAKWVDGKEPGIYGMNDVLDLVPASNPLISAGISIDTLFIGLTNITKGIRECIHDSNC